MKPDSVPPELPVLDTSPSRRLPRWLKRTVPKGNFSHFTAGLVQDLGLQTVCEHALSESDGVLCPKDRDVHGVG